MRVWADFSKPSFQKTVRFTTAPIPFTLNIKRNIVLLGINDIKEITTAMLAYPGMDYTEYSLSFMKRRLTGLATRQRIRRKEQFLARLQDRKSTRLNSSHVRISY